MTYFRAMAASLAPWYTRGKIISLEKAWLDGLDFFDHETRQYFSNRNAGDLARDGVMTIYLYWERTDTLWKETVDL